MLTGERMKRNLSCEMFGVWTCEGCGFEEFDDELQKYVCERHNCTLGGDKNNHPMRLIFCHEYAKKNW